MEEADQDTLLQAYPVKRLFINMLVRDIDLVEAVTELIDNSVDGAKRMRENDDDYEGLFVRIKLDESKFVIEDNCGGIPWELAKTQVFRFGRPEDAKDVEKSVGRFGLGLKRSTFKMGYEILVETTAKKDKYSVPIDVEAWAKTDDPESWVFDAESPPESPDNGEYSEDDRGTRITVTELRDNAEKKFASNSFVTRLRNEVREDQNSPLSKGLEISINGERLASEQYSLVFSDEMKPGWSRTTIDDDSAESDDSPEPVTFKCISGLSLPPNDPDEAGWYVICNGRTVLKASRDYLMGWGDRDEGIPNYHNEYASFRGYAFFDCDDPDRLPWNTTKTGINYESEVFQEARPHIIDSMYPVVSHVTEVTRKLKEVEDKTFTNYLEEVGSETSINEIDEGEFEASTPSFKDQGEDQEDEMKSITFSIEKEKADYAKKYVGAEYWNELGKFVFKYFWASEIK